MDENTPHIHLDTKCEQDYKNMIDAFNNLVQLFNILQNNKAVIFMQDDRILEKTASLVDEETQKAMEKRSLNGRKSLMEQESEIAGQIAEVKKTKDALDSMLVHYPNLADNHRKILNESGTQLGLEFLIYCVLKNDILDLDKSITLYKNMLLFYQNDVAKNTTLAQGLQSTDNSKN